MLAHLKLSTRILLTGAVIAVAFPIPLLTWLLPHQRQTDYAMRTESTRYVVDAAWGILDYYGKQVNAGKLTLAQAQAQAKEALRHERYQNGNYLWINDLRPSMIMHSAKPAMEGSDLSNFHDPNGVLLFADAVRICRAKGEGAIRYMWPKPGATDPLPKISYVKLYPAWGWIVGTGIYVDDVEASLRYSRNLIVLLTIFAVIGAVLLSYFMARSLSAPVRQVTAELTQFTSEAQIAVSQISKASETIANGMSEQASSLEQTSVSLSELTEHTKQSFTSAQKIQGLVEAVGQVVQSGNQQMQEMNDAILQISNSAHQVRTIVKTIDEIAFQTNILALNAAVEAARAGEAGAGFSVVADEVRNLALRASNAARETTDLIANSLNSTAEGAAVSAKLTAAFSEIVAQIDQVNTGLNQITSSFQAETDGIARINSAVSRISAVTQSQAATSEQTASAAQELQSQTASVNRLNGDLLQLVEGPSARLNYDAHFHVVQRPGQRSA